MDVILLMNPNIYRLKYHNLTSHKMYTFVLGRFARGQTSQLKVAGESDKLSILSS